MAFPAIAPAARAQEDGANTKRFAGDGGPCLSVKGLLSVSAVRLGTMELPITRRLKVPADAQHSEFYEYDAPMVLLSRDEDGKPVLLRDTSSNDGIWQAGATIYVTGEWGK